MRHALLLTAALFACGEESTSKSSDTADYTWRPCRTWCEDRVDDYRALSDGAADRTSLPGRGSGAWDADAYLASCADAPETDACEPCSGWYFRTYLEPIAVAGACDFVYRPVESQAANLDEATLEARAEECAETCDDYGLTP
jgi:hypothetical protein